MSPALTTFLFEAANFLLLAGLLGFVLFKPVRRALDEERARHVQEEADQQRLRAEADTLLREARATRASAELELAARRAEVLAAAQQDAAHALEAARKARAAERAALEQALEAARIAQATALAETLGRIAGDSVTRLLEVLEVPALEGALVRAACSELRGLAGERHGPALVEVAHPLDAAARALLEGVLGAGFQERVIADLHAGLRVTTSAGQVDATVGAFARHAARAVTAAASAAEAGGTDG